jgi:hypothetical protein
MSIRNTALNPSLDVSGSTDKDPNKSLSDELNNLGKLIQSGTGATLASASGSEITITGLSGFSSLSQGRYLVLSGATSASNNGEFLILSYISPSSVIIENSSAILPDANNGNISWTERDPYTISDDINFNRTDRQAIKGNNYYDSVPTYTRPSNTSSNVPANLANIAGKTTDAKAFVHNKSAYNLNVSIGNTFITLSDPGNLKHASNIDTTGIPIYDGYDSLESSLVKIVDGYYGTDNELTVLTGVNAGNTIIGLTRRGSSTSPNSVEIEFRSIPVGGNLASSVAYAWESGQPSKIHILYGYRQRIDLTDENAFRMSFLSNFLGGNSVSETNHQTLRQLVHLAESGGPYHGFPSGLYQEILPSASPFPTTFIWWESAAKLKKIVEENITYNANKTINTDTWKVYDTDGTTVLATSVDTYSYSGVFITSITRTLS